MQDRAAAISFRVWTDHRHRAVALALLLMTLALPVSHGAAQDAAPPPDPNATTAPSAAPPQPITPPPDNPGLFEEINKLLRHGAATVRGQIDNTKQQIDQINQNTANTSKTIGDTAATAAGVVVSPLTGRVITGREKCATAPNGAPDCVSAAQELCKRHGYATGKSVDFTSAEQCSPTVYLAGRDNAPTCVTVTFISRAMCQ